MYVFKKDRNFYITMLHRFFKAYPYALKDTATEDENYYDYKNPPEAVVISAYIIKTTHDLIPPFLLIYYVVTAKNVTLKRAEK